MVLDGNAVRSVDRAAALLLALGESQGGEGPNRGMRGDIHGCAPSTFQPLYQGQWLTVK